MSFIRSRLSARARRVIYNDDGGSREVASDKDAFLAERFNRVLNTDVDTYFWCLPLSDDPLVKHEFGDTSQIMIDAARENDLEIWASVRMNDCHEAHWPAESFNATGPEPVEIDWQAYGWEVDDEYKKHLSLARPLKLKQQTDPVLTVGEQRMRRNDAYAPFGSIMNMNWTALDYSHREVREFFLDHIETILRTFDWDGLEMDFLRMPVFFKQGEIEKNIPTMNGFVSQVRAALDKIGHERGRPYPLAVHVPDSPKYCLRCGLDINSWLANDFVDTVVMSTAYKPHTQNYDEFANLCHYHGVPAIVSINCGPVSPESTLDGKYVLERFRGRVSSVWSNDIDGIQLFNLFGSALVGAEGGPLDELNLVGDPAKLIGKDKLFDGASSGTWVDREILADPLETPQLVMEQPVIVRVGDPLEQLCKEGKVREIKLEVRVSELIEEESVQISLNGYPVEITDRRKEPNEKGYRHGGHPHPGGGYWFGAVLDAPPARQGVNYVVVRPGLGCVGNAASRIEDARIWVRY